MDESTIPIVTVFYSNYSSNSKALLQFLKQLNLSSIITIKYINIDNSAIKSVVSRKVSVVPAIVVLLGDKISLYSGENAFEWFNLYMETMEEEVVPTVVEKKLEKPKTKSVMELAKELSQAREQ